jgi:oligopeptide transport system ATP-binding protein
MALLEVKDLKVTFDTPEGDVHAVSGIDFKLEPGDALAIVGESGSGKTQSMMALMGLLAENGHSTGEALYKGKNLMQMDAQELNQHRGRDIAMIFQDPMTSLNPYLSIDQQMTEVLMHHKDMSHKEATAHAIELLRAVRIPDPEQRIQQYPHEYSGGMRQRALVAMGLLCEPDILIADEPTTALDVTVQAQITQLMAELRRQSNTAIVLITHDLGVVASLCDRVLVMYAGEVVEYGTVEQIYYEPRHPYTRGLLDSVPRLDNTEDQSLHAIPGNPPNLLSLPKGCSFRRRCGEAFDACRTKPELEEAAQGHWSRCHLEDSK